MGRAVGAVTSFPIAGVFETLYLARRVTQCDLR